MKCLKYSVLFFLGMTLGQSCLKVKTYPDTPSISVVSSSLTADGQQLSVIEFTDGDGDIGLGEGDTYPPYDTSSKYYNNLLVSYYIDTNGTWIKYGEFGYRVQPITPKGKIKVLEGEIEINTPIDPIAERHKIKSVFVLVDRALHESNASQAPIFEIGN